MSISDLAKKSGIARDTLYAYLNGASTPSGPKLYAIAKAAGVSLDWLAGRPGAAREYGDPHILTSVQAGISEATGLVPVPFYEDVEASAGTGRVVENETASSWFWITRDWAYRYGHSHLSVITATGDSMTPLIEHGNLILLNTAEKSRRAGLRVVRFEEGLLVKYCEPRPQGAMHLISKNNAFEPFTVKAGDYEVIGEVLAVINVLREEKDQGRERLAESALPSNP